MEVKAYLKIHHFDCSLETISDLLKIDPDIAWLKGDIIPNRKSLIYRKQNTWGITSQLCKSESIEEHIQYLLDRIDSKKDIFKELVLKYTGELSVAIYSYEEFNIGVYAKKEIVNELANLGINLDFDIYFLKEAK
jgi:hypothetical protein